MTQVSHRLDKVALFTVFGYAPHPGQVLVHRSTKRRRILICGARWGKSTCAVYECIASLIEPRDSAIGWVVAPTHDLAARIFERVVAILKQRMPHRVVEVDTRERKLVILNLGGGRSELRSKSADNPDSLLGEGLDWLIVDEATRLKEDIWTGFLSQRLVDRSGAVLLVSTPRGRDWVYRIFRQGQEGREADTESWQFPTWTNPHVDSAAIEAERTRLAPDVFAQEYGAEFSGEDLTPCDACGGPKIGGPRVIIAWVEPPPRCAVCGDLLDDDGRSMSPADSEGRRVPAIVIQLGDPAIPELADPKTRAQACAAEGEALGMGRTFSCPFAVEDA